MSNEPLFHSESTSDYVKIWSKMRLPFEPQGINLQLRETIRQNLSNLDSSEGILYAQFTSQDPGFFDVENILFYNVGTSHFSKVSKKVLAFERSFQIPTISPNKISYPYYTEYNTKNSEFKIWKINNTLAEFSFKIQNLSTSTKPEEIWLAAKQGNVTIFPSSTLSNFGLDVFIHSKFPLTLTSIVKPLLDGLISSFQINQANDDQIKRFAQNLGVIPSQLTPLLIDEKSNLLGISTLVKASSKGVCLKPKDDGLSLCRISQKISNNSQTSITGRLFSLESQ